MTAKIRNTFGMAALLVIAVAAVAFTSAQTKSAFDTVSHAAAVAYRAVLAEVHAQDAGAGPRPFGRGGPQGPGGGRFGGPGRGGPGGPMGALGPIMRLNLTDAQKDQVKQIVESHQADTKSLLDRARPAHEALQAAVTSETFDEGAIRTASAQVATIEADLAVARARLHNEVFQILTPEQRTQLKDNQAKMKERSPRR